MSEKALDVQIREAGRTISHLSRSSRLEGFEYLFFALEWLRIGDPVAARNALRNALSVLQPPLSEA